MAAWISERIGRPVAYALGYSYLQRLKHSQQLPRPQHVHADPAAQEPFKKGNTTRAAGGDGFPHATVELWATVCPQVLTEPVR